MGSANQVLSEVRQLDTAQRRATSTFYYRGRVALYAFLKSIGVGTGDLIAVQAFTCVAVPEAIIATGATPVYFDVAPARFSIDPNQLASAINSKFKAVIVQHTFGLPAQIEQIVELCKACGIYLIEDCCHTHDSQVSERKVGDFGHAAFYSYEWGKPIAAGVGGELRVNDPQLAEICFSNYARFLKPTVLKQMRLALQYQAFKYLYKPENYWSVRSCYRFFGKFGAVEVNYQGREARDFELRICPSVLKRLEQRQNISVLRGEHVARLTSIYRQINANDSVIHPEWGEQETPVMSRYPLIVQSRETILAKARKLGLEVADWYCSAVHPLKGSELAQVGYKLGSCPLAEQLSAQTVSLPLHLGVTLSYANRYRELFS